jgi:hypothetical protein
VVNRLEDSQDLRWQGLRGEGGLWAFQVAGTSYRSTDLQAGDFTPGSGILLIPEPTNQYDPNAIAVWDHTRTHHIGYVPKDHLDDIGPILRSGKPYGCIVLWENREDGRRVAIRVLLAKGGARVSVPGRAAERVPEMPPARADHRQPGAGRVIGAFMLAVALGVLIANC